MYFPNLGFVDMLFLLNNQPAYSRRIKAAGGASRPASGSGLDGVGAGTDVPLLNSFLLINARQLWPYFSDRYLPEKKSNPKSTHFFSRRPESDL
jgi:hypothetical protein